MITTERASRLNRQVNPEFYLAYFHPDLSTQRGPWVSESSLPGGWPSRMRGL